MSFTVSTANIARKDFIVYYAGETSAATTYEKIGKGVADAPISQGAEINTVKDILGNTEVSIDSYARSMTIDPVKVDGNSAYATKLEQMEEDGATGADAELWYMGVKPYKTDDDGHYRAWKQKAVVEITDFASGIAGVNMPHTVHFVGARTMGYYDNTAGTFTSDADAAAAAAAAASGGSGE